MDTNRLPTDDFKILKIVGGSIFIGCFGIILYVSQATTWQEAISVAGVALMISGASLLSGGFLGFLFGIPRRLQQPERAEETSQDKKEDDKSPDRDATYGANTNLEQISDWLTKILVGVGLTQISSLPESLRTYADYASTSLGNFPGNKIFALTLLIYFLICGFLIGYLWTRLALGPALRQADIAALGGKLAEAEAKLSEKDRQAAIDTKALSFIQECLKPDPDATSIGTDERELQKKIEAAILPASSIVKAQIFYRAQKMRSENWYDPRNKSKMERTIPIFRALITSDKDNVFHANHGQLAFALKDKSNPTLEDLKEAESELTKAIKIRGHWQEKGWLFYELNRAICRIKLDTNSTKGKKSDKNTQRKILADLIEARNAHDLLDIMKRDPVIVEWTKLNQIDLR